MANVHVLQIAIGIGIAIGIAIGIGIGIDCFATEHFFGFWFQGFRVSRFQGFMVSSKSGSGSGSLSESIVSPRTHGMALLGFLSTDLHRLRRFFGHRSGFFGTPGGIPDFHEVSCVSRFHPN
ncbi:MAG TPA: hypothetical protein PL016_05750, partial [Kiritimatiellia bacterium]|nr:hypothetical protein [Kiritimatiellia bacterium]